MTLSTAARCRSPLSRAKTAKNTALAPHLRTYLMSFLTLGIFWVGQQTQLGQFRRSDRDLTWIHLAFLLGVSLMPFSTVLLADYITYRMAVAVYWLNIALLGALLYAGARYARRAKLIKQDVITEMTRPANGGSSRTRRCTRSARCCRYSAPT